MIEGLRVAEEHEQPVFLAAEAQADAAGAHFHVVAVAVLSVDGDAFAATTGDADDDLDALERGVAVGLFEQLGRVRVLRAELLQRVLGHGVDGIPIRNDICL